MEQRQKPPENTAYLLIFTLTSAVGGFLFGYDTGVIGGANIYIYDDLGHDTSLIKETVVSITIGGAVIGSIISGKMADKLGRKKAIIIADITFAIGALIMALALDIPMLIVGRFIIGVGVGIASMVVPIFLSEAAPINKRGIIVNVNNIFITGGQFIAYLICLACGDN
mmetsp:Transcript_24934/g.4123  ORF Transcript_24934/g.4123 Transcript_24934/m.4123 type:complete len:168 (+) Transcript_24934:30-533(+)